MLILEVVFSEDWLLISLLFGLRAAEVPARGEGGGRSAKREVLGHAAW